ncbi:MAG: YebC/PmpR family DNA-binding transcriptional regulator [Patescibacteria group bacterium]|nr:YebC/PmpR family DNA-binding transcriptional regulator [Patescibacteria group bacterium]
MSGHSKWHNIQARKGKQDALRSNVFSKMSKVIAIAARQGGDPTMNFSLRLAIERAKAAGMPKDNIERALKKGAGGPDGAQMEETLYEAYGPGGVAIVIKGITDNKNRTLQEVKHIVTKGGGSPGSSGSVLWMFGQFGFATVASEQLKMSRDDFEMAMIEAGAEDIQAGDEGMIEIKSKVENFKKVMDKLKDAGIEPKESGLIWEAKDKITVDDAVRGRLENIFSELEENDDIEDYWTNAE